MKKVGVISLGCSKNRVDSEIMMGYLTQSGYLLTNKPEDADILIVNTCGFIDPAKEESIQTILEMAQYKKGKCDTLVVSGCLSERYRDDLTVEMPEIDILIGISQYRELPGMLNARYGLSPQSACMDLQVQRVLSTPAHYAYLRIADGCDNRCSYCAIPLIRGSYRSKPMPELLEEARTLAAQGVKELIVIAQDTTRYGTDVYGRPMLPALLRELVKTDIRWIRLLYTYSDDITDELLDTMVSSEKILKYIDIPVQHVDDALLKRMNRRGSRQKLCNLMEKIRAYDERFVLRTSFIVGFPGETEAQLTALVDFMQTHPFDRAGVFCYSPEEGTPAADYADQIDDGVKARRLDRVMRAQRKVSRALLAKRVGSACDVLIEGYDAHKRLFYGRSYGEAPEIDGLVYVVPPNADATIKGFHNDATDNPGVYAQSMIGSFRSVRMTKAQEYDLYGTFIGHADTVERE